MYIVVRWENRPGIARAPGTEELGNRKANAEAGLVMQRREKGLGGGCLLVRFTLTTGHLLRVQTQPQSLPDLQPVNNTPKSRGFRSGLFLPIITYTCSSHLADVSLFSNNFSKINDIFLRHRLWALCPYTNHFFPCFTLHFVLFKEGHYKALPTWGEGPGRKWILTRVDPTWP